ncbi:alpha/beta hydrolase [Gracilibacillus oryzae]|uniref:Alpha/beta hydrolase n=1 Tax=Gracilibacillus oryzae TaxID=1672701 RepID=A0A7C8GV22_9BACI|nr:alpha/beta hydrolase [Gracilibacillus oryzae]KAB8138887.1 alpha/beta hydrolase [Gracilibacillus oryzae]
MPFTTDKPALYFETTGTGTALLFIPPPGMGHLTFRYQQKLQKTCKIITFDIRGDCRSERGDQPISMEVLVEDVKRILDINKIEKAIICGYSNGGSIAQAFVSDYPERTLGLILIGGYYEVSSFLLKKEYQIGIWIAKQNWMKILALGLSKNHFRHQDAGNEMYHEIMNTDSGSLADQYRIGMQQINKQYLDQLSCPLLLIYGQRDYYIHDYQHLYKSKVNDVEIVYIEKAKHQVPTKYYNECNAVIMNWMFNKSLI